MLPSLSVCVHLTEAPSTCPSHRTLCDGNTRSTTLVVLSTPPTKGSAHIQLHVDPTLWRLQSPANVNAKETFTGTDEVASRVETRMLSKQLTSLRSFQILTMLRCKFIQARPQQCTTCHCCSPVCRLHFPGLQLVLIRP